MNTSGPYRLVGDLTPDRSANCPRDLPADRFVVNGAFDTAAFRSAHPQCFVTNELFPGGFTPRFGGDTRDWSVVAGLRGVVAAFDWELGAGAGVNDIDFFIRNTVNAALGPHNPADFRFDPGAYAQKERSVQLDFAYERGLARLASPPHIAFGAEWRRESFEIEPGDRASWINVIEGPDGPVDLQVQGFSAASNGFPGFSPDTAGRWRRSSHAAYVELDADVLQGWTVVAAWRGERYEDFGSTVNGKLSTRFALGEDWALRATWSSGFRAPTPGQSNAVNATSKQAGEGAERVLAIVATIPPTSSVGESLGGRALEPEVSRDVSVGVTYGGADAHASLDCFRILVRDRLALSRDIEVNRPDPGRVREGELHALEAAGWSSARSWNYINYFTNDFTTLTRGCELAAQLRLEPGNGVTSLRAGVARTLTEVVRFTPGGSSELGTCSHATGTRAPGTTPRTASTSTGMGCSTSPSATRGVTGRSASARTMPSTPTLTGIPMPAADSATVTASTPRRASTAGSRTCISGSPSEAYPDRCENLRAIRSTDSSPVSSPSASTSIHARSTDSGPTWNRSDPWTTNAKRTS